MKQRPGPARRVRVAAGRSPRCLVDLEPPREGGGPPNGSWLNQLPSRPIAWASRRPEASASANPGAITSLASAADVGTHGTEGDRAPDPEAALPDAQGLERVAVDPRYASGEEMTW